MTEEPDTSVWPDEFSEGHPDAVEDYEPHFDRVGTHRRVLGFISDEEHLGRPRNTLDVLAEDLADDPNTAIGHEQQDVVAKHLEALEAAGLVSQKDGVYKVTKAGRVELAN